MTGIARLARELGISTGTVSRALNDKPDVNPETRARVLETARKFGYVANQSARNLAKGKTNAVGFMVELHSVAATHSDNFFMGVCDGMQSVLHEQGLDLILLPCPSTDDPYPYLQRFVARRAVDALVISGTRRASSMVTDTLTSEVVTTSTDVLNCSKTSSTWPPATSWWRAPRNSSRSSTPPSPSPSSRRTSRRGWPVAAIVWAVYLR